MSKTIIEEKEIKKRNSTKIYLIVASIIFGILILPSLPMIMMSAMMFDSPGSEDSISTITIVISMVSYPFITCIGITIGWILFSKRKYLLAILFASIPALNICIGIIAIIYMMIFCGGNFAC
ncbi:hypothetical protein [Aquimarina mytili]|uniref:Uncharacterized protein n=1 Tax=Aquimarina mytili TaxID=874423 RepID=A0A937A133_9FLAO|nr:hypothetical protein [Aquimarina mytili]MBL0684916.1 hypothetical protein [Aquimarina mytili]